MAKLSIKASSQAPALSEFESGKEFDIRKYRPDLKVTGLRFVITAQHVRTLARLTFQGKKVSKSLGTFSHADFDQNLEKLVSQMQGFHQRIAQGLAPFEDEVKPANTLQEFALTIYMPSAEMRKKSYKDDEAKLRMHILPVIGDYPFEDINAGMLNKLLTELRSKGLTNASINRVRALLSVMFNMAINHDLIQVNPVSKVSKFKENNQIERYLNAQEIKRLMDVLNAPHQHGIDNLIIVAIVKFLLLTGVRKREAMDMKWVDVDLTTGVWLLGENKSTKANSTQDNLLKLRDVGTSVLNQYEEDEQFIEQLVAQYDVPSHATTVEILLQIAQLSKVIGNLNDIHAIIEKKQFNTVMSVARAYKSNIVVHYFIKRFYRYNPERYLDDGFQLTPDDAADWLLKGFKQIQKDTAIPFKRVLKDKLVSGIKVDPKTKEVSINPSKAANFFAKYFSVNDRNAKKPASRYLEFTGIAYGNYQFLAIAKYQQPFLELSNEFKLGERTFNPFTGAVISGPNLPLEMIIHTDQPDYFDEGEIENKGEGLGQVA
ncbi:tyrosine-type recombinase/integrase [Acinetobacter pittii]|uniref:tyrosine-type recombinase/integrase n=1 Tax=Acinetobacter pittii TaxID=48296 RepID=UPI000CD215F2|nr:tyrosine-type recombinase/integrase [Acinetobacter pittii]AUT32810.1 tyrosine-type recombinase/integrase [Acinetobacter pittii]QEI26739.1 tyrosine-type recombinase/integrase [Acinetobacter pittii]